MNIEQIKNNNELTIKVSGRLDSNTAPSLENAVNASLEGVNELIFDLERLEYLSSAGLRVLLAAQKQMNKQGHMSLVHVCKDILDIFDMTGFSAILDIK